MKNILLVIFILSVILISGCSSNNQTPSGNSQNNVQAPTTDLGKWGLAVKNRDSSYCDKMQINDFKTFCKAVVSGNFEMCNSLPNEISKEVEDQFNEQSESASMNITRIYCIYTVSLFNGNKPSYVNYCDQLAENDRIPCKARLLKDVNLCNQLSYDSDKRNCLISIAVSTLDSTVCEEVEKLELKNSNNKVAYKEACILQVAIESSNADLCDNAVDRNKCIITVAIQTSNPSLCDRIGDSSNKTLCHNVVK